MKKQKKTNGFLKFTDRVLMWVFGVIGILGSMYAFWLQGGGISVETGEPVVSFGFKHLSFPLCFGVFILALIGGYAITEYFKSESRKSNEYKKITSEDFLHTARWYIILIIISSVMALLSAEEWMVYLGCAAMAFSGSGLIFFKLWQKREAAELAAKEETGK